MTPLALSVVMAASSPTRPAALAEAVQALEAGCRGVDAELLVVGDGLGAITAPSFGRVRAIECAPDRLSPERWGDGARVADGRVIAFTTDQMRVGAGWGRALVASIDAGATGVGGTITLDARADADTAAAHLIRFSAFLPGAHRERHAVTDVAGDNAAYSRAAIWTHTDLLGEGFWEVEFHHRFVREGLRLEMTPDAPAQLVGPIAIGALARQRFAHARVFGSTRVRQHGASRWRIVLAAPLVPWVLLARMRRRAQADAASAGRFRGLLPRLACLACAWAAGEAVGALLGRSGEVVTSGAATTAGP